MGFCLPLVNESFHTLFTLFQFQTSVAGFCSTEEFEVFGPDGYFKTKQSTFLVLLLKLIQASAHIQKNFF